MLNKSIIKELLFLFVRFLCRNYGPTIAVQHEAMKRGCQQVLWLYGEKEEITEVGTMNLFIYWTNAKGGEALFKPPPGFLKQKPFRAFIFYVPVRLQRESW